MKLKADFNRLEIVEAGQLTSGSVGVNTAEFVFVSGWEGLDCTAVFRANNNATLVHIGGDGRCVIPHEALRAPVKLDVGVFGTLGDQVVLTTNYASPGIILKGADRDGYPGMDPEPTVYEEILETVKTLRADVDGMEGGVAANEAKREAAEQERMSAEAVREDAERARIHAEQARADENTGIVARAATQAERAAQEAKDAEASANRAQAEADRATIPAVAGVYNIIIPDRVTGERWELIVEGGVLGIMRVSAALDAVEPIHVDPTTGAAWKIIVEDGALGIEEVV